MKFLKTFCKGVQKTYSRVWQSPDDKNIKTLGNPRNSPNTENRKEELPPSHINEDSDDITHTESTESLFMKPKKHSAYALREEFSNDQNEPNHCDIQIASDNRDVIDMTHMTIDMWAPDKVEMEE